MASDQQRQEGDDSARPHTEGPPPPTRALHSDQRREQQAIYLPASPIGAAVAAITVGGPAALACSKSRSARLDSAANSTRPRDEAGRQQHAVGHSSGSS